MVELTDCQEAFGFHSDEMQNQWRVNALHCITERLPCSSHIFLNVLATLINYEEVHYVKLPIAKYC